eukprot:353588-Chlamydomonas_euryale.AAC.2
MTSSEAEGVAGRPEGREKRVMRGCIVHTMSHQARLASPGRRQRPGTPQHLNTLPHMHIHQGRAHASIKHVSTQPGVCSHCAETQAIMLAAFALPETEAFSIFCPTPPGSQTRTFCVDVVKSTNERPISTQRPLAQRTGGTAPEEEKHPSALPRTTQPAPHLWAKIGFIT